jgi:hypothetical protein
MLFGNFLNVLRLLTLGGHILASGANEKFWQRVGRNSKPVHFSLKVLKSLATFGNIGHTTGFVALVLCVKTSLTWPEHRHQPSSSWTEANKPHRESNKLSFELTVSPLCLLYLKQNSSDPPVVHQYECIFRSPPFHVRYLAAICHSNPSIPNSAVVDIVCEYAEPSELQPFQHRNSHSIPYIHNFFKHFKAHW